MADIYYHKIKWLKVVFQHDDGTIMYHTFDLADPDHIKQMASYMEDYHTMHLEVMKTISLDEKP
jgi:hypothetical protein